MMESTCTAHSTYRSFHFLLFHYNSVKSPLRDPPGNSLRSKRFRRIFRTFEVFSLFWPRKNKKKGEEERGGKKSLPANTRILKTRSPTNRYSDWPDVVFFVHEQPSIKTTTTPRIIWQETGGLFYFCGKRYFKSSMTSFRYFIDKLSRCQVKQP